MRKAALAAITLLAAVSAVASFCESYRGLFLWAERHCLHGTWAASFAAQIDTFIGVGELALFVALVDRWPPRSRFAAWTVTVLGLVVSVAGNVGHIGGSDVASRVTAAVPPLAPAAALAVGLGVLKRVVASRAVTEPAAPYPAAFGNGHGAPEGGKQAAEKYAAELAAGNVPSIRQVQREMHVGAPRAREVRSYLDVLAGSNGHASELKEMTE